MFLNRNIQIIIFFLPQFLKNYTAERHNLSDINQCKRFKQNYTHLKKTIRSIYIISKHFF